MRRFGRHTQGYLQCLGSWSLGLALVALLFGAMAGPSRSQDPPAAGSTANQSGGGGGPDAVTKFVLYRRNVSTRRQMVEKLWAKELREFRKVEESDLAKYRDLVSTSKAGIFRLLPNFDCVAKDIIRVDGECTGYVPESSDFSFRSKMYAYPEDHDIGYVRDEFISRGLFSQGVLVALGDVPIETVTAESDGMRYLTEFRPDELASTAHEHSTGFRTGVRKGDLVYCDHLPANNTTTYGLRFIGYRYGFTMPSRDSSKFERDLADLDDFMRRDIIVAFRVIRRDDHGNLTIVWRELSNKKAPKLKFAKGETRYDFSKQ